MEHNQERNPQRINGNLVRMHHLTPPELETMLEASYARDKHNQADIIKLEDERLRRAIDMMLAHEGL